MISGLRLNLLADAVSLASQNPPDATWREVDPSSDLSPGARAALALIQCGESYNDARNLVYFDLRPDSAGRAGEVRREVVPGSGIQNVIGAVRIITLDSALTFDYRGNGEDSGDDVITVKLVGDLQAAEGDLVPLVDLIPIRTADGVLLSGGTATSRTTVSPGLPEETFAIFGAVKHEFVDGSGWERSNLYLYPPPCNWSIRSVLTANAAANGWWMGLFLPTDPGGELDYMINDDGAARNSQVSITASYAMVPARDGGYALAPWTPDAGPETLVSGGAAATWTNVAVTGGQPGDLVLLHVSATDALGASRAEFGVDIRQITPNDDHQPYTIRAIDTWTTEDYLIRDTVPVILGPGGEFQYQAVNAQVTIEKQLSIGRVQ